MVEEQEPVESRRLRAKFFWRLKFWFWLRERAHPTDLQVTLFWAGVVGFCSAVCSIAFRYATSAVHKSMTGSSDPGLAESFAHLPPLLRLVIPGVGGLVAGAILYFGMRWHGDVITTDYMEAVVLGDGKISARRSLVKCFSALFTIASGGSIGREGPLVQLSSLSASLSPAVSKIGPRRGCVCSSVVARLRA
jgi:CIC family chloride channel protein